MCLLKDNHISCIEQVATDIIGWDRNKPVSLGSQLIKNRRRIAYNGSLFISAVFKGAELLDLQISSIDILEEDDWNKLSTEIMEIVRPLIEKRAQVETHRPVLEDYIRGQIRRRVYAATDIKPVTFLHTFYME